MAGRAGHVSCEKKLRELGLFSLVNRASGGCNSSLPVLLRKLTGRWSQAFWSGAWWEDERQWA